MLDRPAPRSLDTLSIVPLTQLNGFLCSFCHLPKKCPSPTSDSLHQVTVLAAGTRIGSEMGTNKVSLGAGGMVPLGRCLL